jgi:threonine dehydrogenase-like Zn-dependent dehydrogenase
MVGSPGEGSRVGVDGTDKEINAAEYGAAPEGYDFLVTGHESLGRVEAVGSNVTGWPGDVVATVRRQASLYDQIGTYDMTTDDTYLSGHQPAPRFLSSTVMILSTLKIPQGLKEVAVLLEPTTVVQKGIAQAYEIQRRLRVWHPRKAAVMGAGTIGLLATLALRLRASKSPLRLTHKPYRNSDLIETIGARYESNSDVPLMEASKKYGPFDLIFEATGYSPVVFESMQALGKNGVLVLSSVTGGNRKVEVPADKINLEFVLGNKVMVGTVNANREYFEMGVRDMAQAEAEYPGWLGQLLTNPVKGLENYKELLNQLTEAKGAIKVFCEVAPL